MGVSQGIHNYLDKIYKFKPNNTDDGEQYNHPSGKISHETIIRIISGVFPSKYES
jgi:hypothetical protein